MIFIVKVTIKKSYLPTHADPASAWSPHSYSVISVLEEEGSLMNLEGDSFLALDD